MFEKIKNMFNEKDEKKKMENLVAFLIILVVTLILVNKILKDDSGTKTDFSQNQIGTQLVNSSQYDNVVQLDNNEIQDSLETRLEEILSRINGVRGGGCFNNIYKR